MKSYHIPHHGDGRGPDSFPFYYIYNIIQGSHSRLLSGRGSLLENADRRCRVFAILNQGTHDVGQVLKSHQKDQGALLLGQGGVIQHGLPILVISFMTGNHMEGGGIIPVGHRNAAVGRYRVGGRDSRNHFKIQARSFKLLAFLPAPAKDIGVAAF